MMRSQLSVRLRALLVPALVLGASVSSAQAEPMSSVSGGFSVTCVGADLVDLPCDRGALARSISRSGRTGASANDDVSNTYKLKVPAVPTDLFFDRTAVVQWRGSASAGALRAGAFTGFVIPDGSPIAPFEQAAAFVQASNVDDWLIRGPTDVRRRITMQFSLSGVLADQAGTLLPFNQAYAGGGTGDAAYFARVDADIFTGSLAPIAIGFPGGSLRRALTDVVAPPSSFQVSLDVSGGNLLHVFQSLDVFANRSVIADFTGTAKLDYILAPDDITIESSGGTLIRRGDRFVFAADDVIDPPPPVGVPAPGTALLLGFGIAAIAAGSSIRQSTTISGTRPG